MQDADPPRTQRGIAPGRVDALPVRQNEPGGMARRAHFANLLECPGGGWLARDVARPEPPIAHLQHDDHVAPRECGGPRHAEVAGQQRVGVVSHEGAPPRRGGPFPPPVPFGMERRTVRGDMRSPSFRRSSAAIRLWPQVGFSSVIRPMRVRRSVGTRGPPREAHRHRQKSMKPFRCQRISVAGCTMVSASFPAKQRTRSTMPRSVASLARRAFTCRSRERASCFRRKRFSAARAVRARRLARMNRPRATQRAPGMETLACKNPLRAGGTSMRKGFDLRYQQRRLAGQTENGRIICAPQIDGMALGGASPAAHRGSEPHPGRRRRDDLLTPGGSVRRSAYR
jgi:hypothetical protein